MKNKTVYAVIAVLLLAGCGNKNSKEIITEIKPQLGNIVEKVSVSGSVLPQNRLEIMPPVSGRIDTILVREGEYVKKGQTLAYMSSSDRAALLDAARAQGAASIKEWEDTYKPIPLIAPINGQVIVKNIEPGQTVNQSSAVVVLSDRLIVQAQVDETDIGKIKLGQRTSITLDAYPDQIISGKVDHIYYESKTVNNVTMYNVDILPDKVPGYFRSGMSANIDIIQQERNNVLLLPIDAVKKFGDKSMVFVKSADPNKPERRRVETGLSDEENYEIVSGIGENDTVLIMKQNYSVKKAGQTVNPFMPQRPRMGRAH